MNRKSLWTLFSVVLILLAGMSVFLGSRLVTHAANYLNAANVDIALRYVNQNGGNACVAAQVPGAHSGYYDYTEGGQCRGFVGCVVYMASGKTVLIGPGYYNAYRNAGGIQIVTNSGNRADASQAVKGDIIQLNKLGYPETFYNGMHTAFVVARNSDGSFDLVDSNFGFDLKVHHHTWDIYGWAYSHGLVVNIWRFGAVNPSPPPPPPSPYNPRYVSNLYYDVLNRVGSPSEVNGYVQMLNQGTSRTDVANLFLASQEYRTNLVNGYFQLLFGRQPTSSELQAALTQLANGGRDEDLLAGLASSDEFYTRSGGTPNSVASAFYQVLLGRQAASSEIAAVVQQLNAGVPRVTIAHGFILSQEYSTNLVNGYYRHYLNRESDPNGLAYYVAYLTNGGTHEGVITGLVASDEYFGKPTFFDIRYAARLYQDILGRAGSSTETGSVAQALESGASRAAVVNNFLASQEYRTNLVNGYFQLLFGRQPTSSELQAALTQLANGGRDEDLLAGLASSDEFYTKSGGTPNSVASAFYQVLLGRQAASSEIAAVVQQLNAGVPRVTIAHGFILSPEYSTNLVNGYYQHYLGRQADPTGLANDVTYLTNGATHESVITGLVISDEYYWK